MTTRITTPGGERLVLVPAAEYERLTAEAEDIVDAAIAGQVLSGPFLDHADLLEIRAGTLHPLTAWRKAAGLTQTALAQKSGQRRETIANIEARRIVNPRVETVKALADALGVDIENLLPPT